MRDSTRVVASLLVSIPARALSGLIWVYQRTVSPAFVVLSPTCGCRFAPTCSHYAREALRERGLLLGLALTARRLVKCGPWHPGGLDPVPPRQCFRVGTNHISKSTNTPCLAVLSDIAPRATAEARRT
jgi:putative membrane protein insertion efficiency factor